MRVPSWILLIIGLGGCHVTAAAKPHTNVNLVKLPVNHLTPHTLLNRNMALGTALGQAQGTGVSIKRFYQYDQTILEAAKHYSVDPLFIKSVLLVESGLNPAAVSRNEARGIAQFMRTTADALGIANRHDPHASIWGCAALIRRLSDRFDGNIMLVAAAYNAGPQALVRAGREITRMGRETQRYVPSVMWAWKRMTSYHQNNQEMQAQAVG